MNYELFSNFTILITIINYDSMNFDVFKVIYSLETLVKKKTDCLGERHFSKLKCDCNKAKSI